MARFIITILFFVAVNIGWGKATEPDFAYPANVSVDAEARLASAVASNDGPGTLRSLMDMFISRGLIDRDDMAPMLHLADSLRRSAQSPVTRSLISILEADAYNQLYNESRWKYNARHLPLTPLSDRFTEWSGEQFRLRIEQLVDSSLTDIDALLKTPLSDYKSVITQNSETRIYFPTVYNFVTASAIRILTGLNEGNSNPLTRKIICLYDGVMSRSPFGSAPYIYARMGKCRLMNGNNSDENSYFKRMMELYSDYISPSTGTPSTEYAGDILCEIDVPSAGSIECVTLYREIESFLKAYPNYWRKGCLENRLRDMSGAMVNLSAPHITGPGREVELAIQLTNVDKVTLKIYNVSSTDVFNSYLNLADVKTQSDPVAEIIVSIPDRKVPFLADTVVKYRFDNLGLYLIDPEFAGRAKRENIGLEKIYVTDISLGYSSFNEPLLWAVSAVDGAPLGGVDLFFTRDKKTSSLGRTDTDGCLKIDDQFSWGDVTAQSGRDKFAFPMRIFQPYDARSESWRTACKGFSSLPLYHRGDTVQWCAVIYEYLRTGRRVCAGREVTAILIDPAGVELDTLTLTTDSWGRVNGSFALPESGLTGQYGVKVDNQYGAVRFTVSDYKMPSFKIDGLKALAGLPADGDVTLTGSAMTYSGFPLEGAKVSVELSVSNRPRWWFAVEPQKFYTTETLTGSDGRFSVVVPDSILKNSPYPTGFFSVSVSVLSAAGESREAQISFAPANRYVIKAGMDDNIELVNNRVALRASVVTSADSVVDIPVRYSVMNADSVIVLGGEITNGEATADFKDIPSGEYKIIFSLPLPYIAEEEVFDAVIYRSEDKLTPLPGRLLWSPQDKVTTSTSGKGQWLYATDCPTHLLVVITANDSILSKRWVKTGTGMGRLDVDLPEGIDAATMSVNATGLYRSDSRTVRIVRGDSDKGIRIVVDSFRDRLRPSSTETWTIRVVDLKGHGRAAAVIADMYDTAIDAITRSSWSFQPVQGNQNYFYWRGTPLDGKINSYLYGRDDSGNRECPQLTDARFQTYGYSLTAGRNALMLRAYKSSAVMVRGSAVLSNKSEDMVEEAMADTDSYAGAVATASEASAESNDEFRESEAPLAFFRPDLATDSCGNINLTFTLPGINTTWGFRAIAWTDSVLTTSYSADIVAAKMIMVKASLPRFLRHGDKATLPCMVMNASDSARTITAVTEIFNPADGEILLSRKETLELRPSESAAITVPVEVPASVSMLGYRVKAQAAQCGSDGEQTVIPVLPATMPVVETRTFALSPDSSATAIDINLDSISGRDVNVSIQLCQNPVWYLVTALPGIAENKPSTSVEAMRSLFTAAVASGLMADNPAIAEALRMWQESDSAARILTSMLSRNSDLTTVLLSATPWTNHAESEAERMSRLGLLLNSKNVARNIDNSINLLGTLFNDDEAWKWSPRDEVTSEWATHVVLTLAGQLQQLGYLPKSQALASMLHSALDYDTRKTKERFKLSSEGDFSSYVYLHDLFKSLGIGAPDANIVNSTIDRIIKNWKKSSLDARARYAVILHNHGYKSMSKTLIESILQFARPAAGGAIWFPSLKGGDMLSSATDILWALLVVTPESESSVALSRWIIMQKGTQSWNNASVATRVIAVLLHTSASRWLTRAYDCDVTLDGHKLTVSPLESFIGESYTRLPKDARQLEIASGSDAPAWGALFTSYTAPVDSVRAAACNELSIRKTLLVNNPDGAPVALEPGMELKVGQRVTVLLTLTASATVDYMMISDPRAATFEPVEQTPSGVWKDGLGYYIEPLDTETRIFIDRLPAGTYQLTYDLWVTTSGDFASSPASVQSQYAPAISAHSAGQRISVVPD